MILRTDNLLAGELILPFGGGCLPLCCPAPLPCGNYSAEAERGSGIGLKLFGFIPESRSRSPGFLTFELAGRKVDVCPVRLDASDDATREDKRALEMVESELGGTSCFVGCEDLLKAGSNFALLLGRYLGIAPGGIKFSYGSKGKPTLADPASIRFNASHSGRLALLAFTLDCEVDVDVEQIRQLEGMPEIASRFFCAEEAAELMSLPSGERERAFLFCRTRKEAYIKPVGEGLSVPLDGFRVTLRPREPARFVHLAQRYIRRRRLDTAQSRSCAPLRCCTRVQGHAASGSCAACCRASRVARHCVILPADRY